MCFSCFPDSDILLTHGKGLGGKTGPIRKQSELAAQPFCRSSHLGTRGLAWPCAWRKQRDAVARWLDNLGWGCIVSCRQPEVAVGKAGKVQRGKVILEHRPRQRCRAPSARSQVHEASLSCCTDAASARERQVKMPRKMIQSCSGRFDLGNLRIELSKFG